MPGWLAAPLLVSTALAGDWATLTVQDGLEVRLESHGLVLDHLGRPHIVWAGDDALHHALLDGPWSIEDIVPPDSLPGPALQASATLWGQQVAVAWSQDWSNDLYWGTGTWADWDTERVADLYYQQGSLPVIVAAPDGTLQIVAHEWGLVDELKLLRWDPQTGWDDLHRGLDRFEGRRVELAFDSASVPYYVWQLDGELPWSYSGLPEFDPPIALPPLASASGVHILAVDGQDRPVVAVQDGEAVVLHRLVGADWTSELLGLASPQLRAPGLAIDGAGWVHVLYIDDVTLEVRHVEEGPNGWTTEIVHHEFPGSVSLAASSDEVHVAHVRDHTLRYGHRDDLGDWTWEEVARSSKPGYGVAAVHDGTGVWMAHQDGGSGGVGIPDRLRLSFSDGTVVTHHEIADGPLFFDTELALGLDGDLRLTRVDSNGVDWDPVLWSSELVLMTGEPGAWTESVASRPEDAPREHALALDPLTDEAVIAYVTPNLDAWGDTLVLARQSGAGWTHEVVHDNVGGVDVEVGQDGTVHLGVRDLDGWLLRYLTDAGGTWTDEVVDDTGATLFAGCGDRVAIDLDPDDDPHLLYDCEVTLEGLPFDRVWHADLQDGQWSYEQVQQGVSVDLALRVDDAHTTHVAMSSATFDSLWVGDDGGTHFLSSPVASGVGSLDLALSPDGELFVAWQDLESWDLHLSLASPALDVQPTVLNFGIVPVTTTAEQTVTVTNVGTTTQELPEPILEGPHPQAFELLGVCGTLQPQDSCTWTVRFVPDRVLDRVATLRLAPGHEVVLAGTGRGVIDVTGCSDGCGSGCGTADGAWAPWVSGLLVVGGRRRYRR